MKRTALLWLAFTLCLAVVLSAMAWVSWIALGLDDAEARARRQAALEENVRLALWRMDSSLAPLLAQESARPPAAYNTFLPLDRGASSALKRPAAGGEVLAPSPLLAEVSPHLRVHFQFNPDGGLSGSRVPQGRDVRLAVPNHLSPDALQTAQRELACIQALADRQRLLKLLPSGTPLPLAVVLAPAGPLDNRAGPSRRREAQGYERGAAEFGQRSQILSQNTNVLVQSQLSSQIADSRLSSADTSGVVMTPLWLDGELILARRVMVSGREYVQGCLLDWPAVKKWLREMVEDLLPDADLEPVVGPTDGEARLLAVLPARLAPGELSSTDNGGPSPIWLTLSAAWVCVLVAAAAVAGLLAGVVRLSERRSAFVSAVTHELRTPLTTFHMYTEMLSEGMVSDAQRQQEYLMTLRTEAARLSHLVENVLAYARLERGRPSGRTEPVSVARLVETARTRLTQHAAQAGMELVVEAEESILAASVCANPLAVEQILFNLVDNACKYAAAAADKRVHLTATQDASTVRILVRDHGPGLSRPVSRRLFRPFSKSAREAANSAPGVGLGLALSNRLAQDMGARLQWDSGVQDGACFVLSLSKVVAGTKVW
jgi:signal transduction histidine kinase